MTEHSTDETTDPKEELRLSRESYTDRRDERIAYYYFVRRVTKPPAIYDFLVRECRECLGPDVGSSHAVPSETHKFIPLISSNRASGLRTVQEVVMRIRRDAEPEEVLALRRPVETEKVRKTLEYLLQKQIEVIEDRSSVQVQKLSPGGEVVTVIEPRCSQLEKGKAIKAAMLLAEKIGRLTGASMSAEEDPPEAGAGKAGGVTPELFAIEMTGSDFDALVQLNATGKPN